jgi:hypothetical protein
MYGGMHSLAAQARRRAAVLSLVLTHGGLAVIGLFGRLKYTRPPRFEFLELVAGSDLWILIHGGVAVLLALTLTGGPSALSRSLSASAAALGTWSFFMFLWGLWPVGPVSLGAPILGFAVAVGAHLLSRTYAEAALTHGKG